MQVVFCCLAFLAVCARAYSTELGAHAGYLPAAEYIAEIYCSSPAMGVDILVHRPEFSIGGSLTIVFPQHDTEIEIFSASMIPILAGVRYKADPIFTVLMEHCILLLKSTTILSLENSAKAVVLKVFTVILEPLYIQEGLMSKSVPSTTS